MACPVGPVRCGAFGLASVLKLTNVKTAVKQI